jgi:hypothetical protein
VYDGANGLGTLYVDGAFDTSSSVGSPIPANTQDILIGDLPGGGTTFTGKICEVAIWARALGADEIQSIYRAGATF